MLFSDTCGGDNENWSFELVQRRLEARQRPSFSSMLVLLSADPQKDPMKAVEHFLANLDISSGIYILLLPGKGESHATIIRAQILKGSGKPAVMNQWTISDNG